MKLYRLRQPGDPDNSLMVEWYYPDEEDVFEEFNPNIEAAARVRMKQDNDAFNEASKHNDDLARAGWLVPPVEQTRAIVAAAFTRGDTDGRP